MEGSLEGDHYSQIINLIVRASTHSLFSKVCTRIESNIEDKKTKDEQKEASENINKELVAGIQQKMRRKRSERKKEFESPRKNGD